MKMNKKGIIGIASACVAGIGVFLGYLETKNNEDFLDSIENRLADVEKFYNEEGSEERSHNEEAGAGSETEEAD